MFFEDFFDIHNPDHLRAYLQFMGTGQWPEGFPPAGIRMHCGWENILQDQIVRAWIERELNPSQE
jgi:hypothetical protein